MIEDFERVLASCGEGDALERTRSQLVQKAEDDRRDRLGQIEDDYRTAQLIRYALNQDRRSPAYAVAKGIQNWLRRKYPDSNDGNLARSLMRDLKREEYEQRKETANNENTGAEVAGAGQ